MDQGLFPQDKYNAIVNIFMGDVSPSNFKLQLKILDNRQKPTRMLLRMKLRRFSVSDRLAST